MFGLNKTIHKERAETILGRFPSNVIGEIEEPYQKYFYCPKVSRKERHIGSDMPEPMFGDVKGCYGTDGKRMAVGLDKRGGGNNHPTVKPVELMKYLVKLITPPNGKVLDPFNGSGSTGMAATSLGHHYTGIDLDEKYIEISKKRIEAYNKEPNTFSQLFTDK
jgi:DNA modification methylase